MSDKPDLSGPADPRVLLAAERTLLAWLRTGIALMGLGFVVARFGLFLRELALLDPDVARLPASSGWSQTFGILLIVLGIGVNLVSALQYAQFLKRAERGEPYRPSGWSLATFTAVLLALLGGLMVVYLMTL